MFWIAYVIIATLTTMTIEKAIGEENFNRAVIPVLCLIAAGYYLLR
jgi:hypothetical protein